MLHSVVCLDTGATYKFVAADSLDAIKKMLYTADILHKDPNAVIEKTKSGLHYFLTHNGNTYAVRA